MTCRPITEDDLHAYVDDVLDSERLAEVSAYLDAHSEVAEQVGAYRAERKLLRDALASTIEEPVPPELNLRRMIEARRQMIETEQRIIEVERLIGAEREMIEAKRQTIEAEREVMAARRRPSGVSSWAMGAAAVLLLFLGGIGGWTLRGVDNASPSGLTALGEDAAASFVVYAPDNRRPVEIRAKDRSTLTAWMIERTGREMAIPELAAVGYRFMGGRILSTINGAAVLFMYDDDRGRRLVVLARPMPSAKDTLMTSLTVGNVNGFIWSDSGFGYSMVGAVTPNVLRPLADEVRRQVKRSI